MYSNMSLDSQLNSQDEDFKRYISGKIQASIGKIDSGYLGMATWLAEKWQNHTHQRKSVLETAMYTLAFAGFGAAYADDQSYFFAAGISGINAIISSVTPSDSHQGRLATEILGFSKKSSTYKSVAVFSYSLGILALAGATGQMIYGIASKDFTLAAEGMQSVMVGIGISAVWTGLYLERVDIGNPPPKRKRKPLKEKMQEVLNQLLPKPVEPEAISANS